MLIPAFISRGIVSGGFELGRINAGIQLAPADRITEYAVIQSTTIGVRGIIAPLISAMLLHLGLPPTGIFVISAVLVATAWVLFGSIDAPAPATAPVTGPTIAATLAVPEAEVAPVTH